MARKARRNDEVNESFVPVWNNLRTFARSEEGETILAERGLRSDELLEFVLYQTGGHFKNSLTAGVRDENWSVQTILDRCIEKMNAPRPEKRVRLVLD